MEQFIKQCEALEAMDIDTRAECILFLAEVKKLKERLKQQIILPPFDDCKEAINKITQETYEALKKEPDEKKVNVMAALVNFYGELKIIATSKK